MANYDDRDDTGDNDVNEDRNNDENAAFGSGPDGPIFNLIMPPWSHEGVTGNDSNGAAAVAHYVSSRWTIYLPYKDHIKDVTCSRPL